MDSEDEFGDSLTWDDAALEELDSLDTRPAASAAAVPTKQARAQPPRASQVPPQRRPAARVPPPAPTQQRRPGASQFPGGLGASQGGAAYLGQARAGILRPPRPPQRAAPAQAPPAQAAGPPPVVAPAPVPAPAPAPKRFPRQSLNERGEPGFVDPNPFAGRRAAAPKHEADAEEDVEEDLPAISVDELGGGYRAEPQRGVTVARAAPPALVREASAVLPSRETSAVPPGGPTGAVEASLATETAEGRGGGPMQDLERRELELLRAEKEKLAQQLAIAKAAQQQLERQVMTKTGENSVVRQRLTKAEAAHAAAMKAEQRDKALLQEQLEAKERDYRAATERMKMEEAFRKQEVATTAAPGSASSQRHYHHPNHAGLSSAKSQRFYGRAASVAPAPAPAASPSVDRSAAAGRRRPARAVSEAPGGLAHAPAPAPTFAGFQSAFGPPSTSAVRPAGQGDREGSMGPPRKRVRREAPRTPSAPEPKRRREDGAAGAKGTGRLMLVEEENGDGDGVADETAVGGYEHGDAAQDQLGNDGDEGDAWIWVPEERDMRSELLATILTHTTIGALDVEPAVLPPAVHPYPHHVRSTAAASIAFATASTARLGTARYGAGSSTFGGRATAAPVAPANAPTGPVPTFHALINLRLPPTTEPELVAEYERRARDTFALLGHYVEPHGGPFLFHSLPAHLALFTHPEDLDAAHLAMDLAHSLTGLLGVLEAATLTGPMTALLRLMSHLAFLFPPFAHACCAASDASDTRLLALLARVLARYARPDPPTKDPSAAALLARGGPLAQRSGLRSRKARVARPSATAAPAGRKRGGKDGKEEGEERVVLESGKRGRLVDGVLGVLEGVAWRCLGVRKADEAAGESDGGRAAEEVFIAFLKTPNAVATLLDPNHPVNILQGSARLLALLACRPALFRTLLATKFHDAPDVRASKVPLVDRLATLLVVPRAESLSAHALDQTLLAVLSLLLTAHEDAILLAAQAASFVPEVLAKMWRDVRTLWEWDGREAGKGTRAREMLDRTTTRLSTLVHLFYYLSLAPHSSLTISDLLAGPSAGGGADAAGGEGKSDAHHPPAAYAYARQAVNDLYMTALGTVAFATLGGDAEGEDGAGGEGGIPSWAEEGSTERRVLCELGYLVQEILEDVSPLELEEIEVCFALPEDETDERGDGDEDEEMAEREGEGEDERQLAGVEEGV